MGASTKGAATPPPWVLPTIRKARRIDADERQQDSSTMSNKHKQKQVTAIKIVVKIDDRTLTVGFGFDGKPLSIKERKLYMPGTYYECWYNAPIWHHSHGVKGPETLTFRAIEAAELKLRDVSK